MACPLIAKNGRRAERRTFKRVFGAKRRAILVERVVLRKKATLVFAGTAAIAVLG